MILVDTSIWIDHLRSSEPALVEALEQGQVLAHPMIVGEIALGSLRQRGLVIALLGDLPFARVATHDEMLGFIEAQRLSGIGIGLVDAHLLASARLTPNVRLWSRDKRLREAARRLKVDAAELD